MARARTTEALYAFSRKLAGVGTLDDVLWATAYQIALMLKVRVVLLLPEDGSIAVKAGYPPEDTLDEADLAAAKWAWENNRAGRPRLRHAARRQAAVPADAHRPRRHRRGRHRQRQAGPAAHARPAAAARRADRPGRARDRARPPGRGHRPRQAHGRDRPAALGAADLDLARSQDAARRGARRGRHAARPVGRSSTSSQKAELLGDDHRRGRAAQPLHRQSARHDQARVRRDRAERRPARSRRDRRQRAAARQQDPGAAPGRGRARRRSADGRARRRAVRAGAVQSARQCRQVRPGRHHDPHPELARRRARSACRCSTRATAFRPTISSASSTSSTARRRATRCAPAPVSVLRSRAASSRPCTAPSRAANRTDRTGAVFTIRLPIPAQAERLDTAA